MATKEVLGKITLLNVRLSFPSIYEPNVSKNDDGSTRENWKANFLVPKDALDSTMAKYGGQKMTLREAISKASNDAKEKKWGADKNNWPKLKAEKKFWRDGDEENWDGYPGCMYVSSNAMLQDKPAVLTNRKGKDGKWIEATPGGANSPYSGCWVNATVVIWVQDNEHGKRINAQLKAVQFVKDGEAFGAAPVDPNEEFDDDDVSDAAEIGDEDDQTSGADEQEDEEDLV